MPEFATYKDSFETIKLALPIALTQLGQVAMMTSDLALLGRLGDHVVAASALAGVITDPRTDTRTEGRRA